ncbi:MAG: hypothetical protein O3B41_06690 [Bacteroidetes bacterium]|nr:hypothetical protein [Bacteroidota bacterium]
MNRTQVVSNLSYASTVWAHDKDGISAGYLVFPAYRALANVSARPTYHLEFYRPIRRSDSIIAWRKFACPLFHGVGRSQLHSTPS